MTEEKSSFKSGFVAIVGRTNVGKSTLLNKLAGRKVAIVSEKPQTTRNKILCVLNREDSQVIFLDTPGIHKPKYRLGEQMVQQALGTLKEVDAILFLVESEPPGPGDNYIMRQFKDLATPVLLVINKIDLVRHEVLLPLIEQYSKICNFSEIVPLSALTGENMSRLLEAVTAYLPEGPKYFPDGMVTDRPETFIVTELIREKVLHLTSEEVPHSVAVVIEEMEDRPNGVIAIRSIIYTEKETQKAILIGKGGQMLKKIGQTAREEIEGLLGSKVFLDLWVKVKPGWRNKESQIRDLGYMDEE